MNETKVRELINKEISELHNRIGGKSVRHQYAPAKHQIAKLTELGLLHLMPKGFGHSDAKVVIEEATSGKQTFITAYGEGEEAPASPMYVAINSKQISDCSPIVAFLRSMKWN
jgi:hypothetical protein